ncbi:MAG: hypothetical protein KJO40_05205 [Deltaproteobacteria bacterium]|nr:hypothetical protein [Deltaproteobacteria bacterium]NND29858.1 hypothetical protein [Myxococcales bacterium]MBT8480422.1 hypothetical protein [Deltaproteobacteria bacterium]NNK07901.1 hypothetical protein [Myxococcales bacterium]NNK43347.1 hypothetical protein [Myxococcales bacterium]
MSRGRAHWGVLACALWLLGFDVIPLVHLVFHDALEKHHHGHPQEHAHPNDHEEKDRSPAEHGEGSVAHRDLAANAPSPGVPEVLEALLAWSPPALPSRDERPTDRQPRTIRARAPPRVAA